MRHERTRHDVQRPAFEFGEDDVMGRGSNIVACGHAWYPVARGILSLNLGKPLGELLAQCGVRPAWCDEREECNHGSCRNGHNSHTCGRQCQFPVLEAVPVHATK
jgi:hypothetical protein